MIVAPSLVLAVLFGWLAYFWTCEHPRQREHQVESVYDGEAQAVGSIVAALLCLALPIAIHREQAQPQRPGFKRLPAVVIRSGR